MRNYQVIVVVKTGSDAERGKTMDFVKGLLKGVKIAKENDLGSKALSYKIKAELSGHYYELLVEGDSIPQDFEKKLVENEAVLRHLVLAR